MTISPGLGSITQTWLQLRLWLRCPWYSRLRLITVHYARLRLATLPTELSNSTPTTIHPLLRLPTGALRLTTLSYAIRFLNRIKLPSEVVCDRKSSCEERSWRLTTVCRECRKSASWPTFVGRVASLRRAFINRLRLQGCLKRRLQLWLWLQSSDYDYSYYGNDCRLFMPI